MMPPVEYQFEPVHKNSIVVELTRRLMEYLFSGAIRPGQRLPAERQLSEALGVGRSSLREALKALTVLGLLEVRHGDGTYLKKADSGLLTQAIEWGLLLGERKTMDLIEARQKIEIAIAGLAAERCGEQDVKELESILSVMRAAGTNFRAYTEADVKFHFKLYQMSDNSVLREILRSIRTLLSTWINAVIESAGETDFSYRDHADIFEAVKQKDARAAAEAMEKHMLDAGNRLKQVIRHAELAQGRSGDDGM